MNKVTRKPEELHQCFCYNNEKLSLDEIFDSLLEFQNSISAQTPLSTSELYKAATLICENIVVTSAEFEFKFKNDSIAQILRLMSVMLLKSECGDIFINLHEFILTPDVIGAFLLCGDDSDIASVENPIDVSEPPCISDELPKSRNLSGQLSITSKFPSIVNIAAEFVKQHGFSAHNRRRNETANTSVVSITQIKEHLIKAVPGLKEHGISKTTIRRLFQPPNRENTVSRRYTALIDARRAMKSTSYREYHPDNHYLFARNKHRRGILLII